MNLILRKSGWACLTSILMLAVYGAAFAQTGGAGSSVGGALEPKPCPEITPETEIDESATFTWMYSVGNTSFDPDKITSVNSQMYLFPIYDSLVYIDESGKPQPMLAKSWQLVDNGKTLELSLIENWKYHDGTPFDAASVKANLERSMNLPGSFNANALKAITDIEVIDEHTIQLKTNLGAGALVGVLGGSAGMMMSPKVFDDSTQALKPTGGSGAYRLTEYVPGSRAVYTAVDNYWAPEAQNVEKMVFLVSPNDNARLNSVISGQADATFLRASMYAAAKAQDLVICNKPSLSSYNININTDRSEFGDKRVRQALNYAINRQAISVITNGFCKPSIQLFPPFYFASDPDADRYAYNPEKARALLEEAGLGDGFSFDLMVINLSLYEQIAEIIQANLAQVGVTMSITSAPIQRIGQAFAVEQSVDAVLSEQKAAPDPSILTSSYYLANGFQNPGGYTTNRITKLEAKAAAPADPEKRAPIYEKLFEAVIEEAYPNITLCHLTTPFVLNDSVVGLDIYANAARHFRGVAIRASDK